MMFEEADQLRKVLFDASSRVKAELGKFGLEGKKNGTLFEAKRLRKNFCSRQVYEKFKDYFVDEKAREEMQKGLLGKKNMETRRSRVGKLTLMERQWNNPSEEAARNVALTHKESKLHARFANHRSDWVEKSRINNDHQIRRLRHLLALIETEQHEELAREKQVHRIAADPRQHSYDLVEIAKKRVRAADTIMDLLYDYNLISLAKLAEYDLENCSEEVWTRLKECKHQKQPHKCKKRIRISHGKSRKNEKILCDLRVQMPFEAERITFSRCREVLTRPPAMQTGNLLTSGSDCSYSFLLRARMPAS